MSAEKCLHEVGVWVTVSIGILLFDGEPGAGASGMMLLAGDPSAVCAGMSHFVGDGPSARVP